MRNPELRIGSPARTSVRELIRRCTDRLEAAGFPSPRSDAERLLADALAVERSALYLTDDEPSERVVDLIDQRLERRLRGEPLQYLAGTTQFCDVRLAVSPAVLIPRPETELLVEAAAEALRAIIRAGVEAPSVLDVGTGSGAIAIALARRVPACHVLAVELSWAALQVARSNVIAHGLDRRIALAQADWTTALRGPCDLVVSNPPYVPTDELSTLPADVLHEPRMSLDGGPDGLTFVRRLLDEVPRLLRAGGALVLECAEDHANALAAAAQRLSWVRCSRVLRDLAGRPRVVRIDRLLR